MMNAVIGGFLTAKPECTGEPFVSAQIRAFHKNGQPIFVNATVFAERLRAAMLALEEGDRVRLAGVASPKEIKRSNKAGAALELLVYEVRAAPPSAENPPIPRRGRAHNGDSIT
jgi:hypothetical protein